MNLWRLFYNVAMLILAAPLLPVAYGACRLLSEEKAEYWCQRLGLYPDGSGAKRPLVWIHAVSVGEVGVACALIEALDRLRPGLGVVLSTTTRRGQELARVRLARRAQCLYFPLDIIVSVRRALQRLRPDLVVCLETELWPNFLGEAQRLEIPSLLLNGRVSTRSYRRYRKIRPLLAPILQNFVALAMVSRADAERIVEMGARATRVVVTGNMKGAGLLQKTRPEQLLHLKEKLQLGSGQRVLIAGSIRRQELTWLPEVFCRLTRQDHDLVGIFAPRHLSRLGRIESWFQLQGRQVQRFSVLVDGARMRESNIILVDRIGVLFDLYGLADLVFCGGSLVPLGGQNILEPAAWGKVVFYGPHMDNFLQACHLLERAGCGIMVEDREELLEKWRYFLAHPEKLWRLGRRGRLALKELEMVGRRQTELILKAVDGKGGNPLGNAEWGMRNGGCGMGNASKE